MNLFKYASTKYNPIKTMFMYLAVSETQCIIFRPDLLNSQASRKKLKKWIMVETKFSFNFKTKNTFIHD